LPPLALGLLDRYTNKEIPLRYPPMYKISQDSTLFNVRVSCISKLFTIKIVIEELKWRIIILLHLID